jgi:hypothetical protein
MAKKLKQNPKIVVLNHDWDSNNEVILLVDDCQRNPVKAYAKKNGWKIVHGMDCNLFNIEEGREMRDEWLSEVDRIKNNTIIEGTSGKKYRLKFIPIEEE